MSPCLFQGSGATRLAPTAASQHTSRMLQPIKHWSGAAHRPAPGSASPHHFTKAARLSACNYRVLCRSHPPYNPGPTVTLMAASSAHYGFYRNGVYRNALSPAHTTPFMFIFITIPTLSDETHVVRHGCTVMYDDSIIHNHNNMRGEGRMAESFKIKSNWYFSLSCQTSYSLSVKSWCHTSDI